MEELGVPGPGNALENFFVLSADANRDRIVNLQDFNILATNFGLSGRTFSQGNFNYSPDGLVNLQDFNILGEQFGVSLPQAPAGPGIIEVGVTKDFTFELMWADTISGEQGWRVQQSLSGQFDEDPIIHYDLPANTTNWPTPVFPDGTRVWWRSRAFGNGQDTAYTPKRYGITPLPEPTITEASPLSSSQIQIIFTDNSQNEASFQVYRSLNPGSDFDPVGNPILSGAPMTFVDSGLNPSTTYYYYVRARNAVTDSGPSTIRDATTLTTTGVSSNVRSTAQINIDWPDSTNPNVFSYNVYRGNTPGFAPSLDNLIAFELETSSLADADGDSATTYHYKITEVHADGSELPVAWSGSARTLTIDTSVPPMPSITDAFGANESEITLRWVDNSPNETGFSILQSDGSGGWTLIGATEPNAEAYTVRNLDFEANYTFALQATNTAGTSPTTAPTTASTQPRHEYFVALVGGHFQTQAYLDAGNSVGAIATLLRANQQLNLNVHVYAEYVTRRQHNQGILPAILTMGRGQAYTDFRRFYDQGHRRWAIAGYSHGGGLTFQFAQRIENENPTFNPARLGFSAYIDALQRTNEDDHALAPILAELRRPPASVHHLNIYELRSVVHGNNMGAQANQNIQRFLTDDGRPISHENIVHQAGVQDYVADELIAHLQALP